MNQSVSIKTQLQKDSTISFALMTVVLAWPGLHPCLHADPAIHFTEGRVEFVKYK